MNTNMLAINEDLANLIMEKGRDGKLNLEEQSLQWTWFDDDADNCGSSLVESISMSTDVNGEQIIFVDFDNRESANLDNLNYEDVLGNNFAQWLYYELV